MSDMEIEKVLVCSTGHVTEAEAQAFDSQSSTLRYMTGEYGWLVLVPQFDADGNTVAPVIEGASESLQAVLTKAFQENCRWARFDRDADPIEGIETHAW